MVSIKQFFGSVKKTQAFFFKKERKEKIILFSFRFISYFVSLSPKKEGSNCRGITNRISV